MGWGAVRLEFIVVLSVLMTFRLSLQLPSGHVLSAIA